VDGATKRQEEEQRVETVPSDGTEMISHANATSVNRKQDLITINKHNNGHHGPISHASILEPSTIARAGLLTNKQTNKQTMRSHIKTRNRALAYV
jgi:hypothetical protein